MLALWMVWSKDTAAILAFFVTGLEGAIFVTHEFSVLCTTVEYLSHDIILI